jgi:Protein of unknown function (DUF3892)
VLAQPDGKDRAFEDPGRDDRFEVAVSVIVVKCPTCSNNDYIKTTADSTTADNLLSLPSF